MCVCVCVCVCEYVGVGVGVCVRACVRVCVRVLRVLRVSLCVCTRVCQPFAQRACTAKADGSQPHTPHTADGTSPTLEALVQPAPVFPIRDASATV